MKNHRPDRGSGEDLLARARRGGLSEAEQGDLEQALETSAALKAAFAVGTDFDRLATVRAGDDELIARAAAGALHLRSAKLSRRPVRASRPPARRLAWAVGVAATCAAMSAAAAWSGIVRPILATRTEVVVSAPAKAAEPERVRQRRLGHATAAQDEDTAATPSSPPDDPVSPAPLPSSHPTARAEVTAPTRATAQALFRKANAARRQGASAGALDLYVQLQRAFPESDEARLSHVSMGTLLLAAGRAAEADRQLSQYLSSGGGALAEEAMVGRARCLEQLGRADDERQLWTDLLRVSPSSVYANQARQRIAQIATRVP